MKERDLRPNPIYPPWFIFEHAQLYQIRLCLVCPIVDIFICQPIYPSVFVVFLFHRVEYRCMILPDFVLEVVWANLLLPLVPIISAFATSTIFCLFASPSPGTCIIVAWAAKVSVSTRDIVRGLPLFGREEPTRPAFTAAESADFDSLLLLGRFRISLLHLSTMDTGPYPFLPAFGPLLI